jgi:hypothetical protein
MLVIIILGLFATLSLVSGDCDHGTLKGNDFDWYKVGNSVLTYFLWQIAAKTSGRFHISFVVTLKISQ